MRTLRLAASLHPCSSRLVAGDLLLLLFVVFGPHREEEETTTTTTTTTVFSTHGS